MCTLLKDWTAELPEGYGRVIELWTCTEHGEPQWMIDEDTLAPVVLDSGIEQQICALQQSSRITTVSKDLAMRVVDARLGTGIQVGISWTAKVYAED